MVHSRYNPGKLQPRKWENAFTIDKNSWGLNRNGTINDYMTVKELVHMIIGVVAVTDISAPTTQSPFSEPTAAPSTAPVTDEPTDRPSEEPTLPPVAPPVIEPTQVPVREPSTSPTDDPTSAPISPTASPSSGPTKASAGALCEIRWNGPDIDVGIDGFDTSYTIETACLGIDNLEISMDLSHGCKLEATGGSMDTLEVSIKMDNMPESPWLYFSGELYDSTSSIIIAAGSELTLRVSGKTIYFDEIYMIRDFVVKEPPTEASVESPSTSPPTKSPAPTPLVVCR